jgi:hypothetical protein
VPASLLIHQALVLMLACYLLIMTALRSGLHLLTWSKADSLHGGRRTAERPDGTSPDAGLSRLFVHHRDYCGKPEQRQQARRLFARA